MLRVAARGALLAVAVGLAVASAAFADPLVTTEQPEGVTSHHATLTGSFAQNGDPNTDWQCGFEYGYSNYLFGNVTASCADFRWTIDVEPTQTYSYRAYATSGANPSSAYGSTVDFTAAAPMRATTGGATRVTDTAATLSGTATADPDASPSEVSDACWVEVKPAAGGSTVETGSASPCTPGHVRATGLDAATKYAYRLVTYYYSGYYDVHHVYGDWAYFTTTRRSATTGPAVDVRPDTADVRGSSSGTYSQCWFEYGKTRKYDSYEFLVDDCAHAQATLSYLDPGATYHYRFVAHPDTGADVAGQDRTFRTPYPSCTDELFDVPYGEQLSFYVPRQVFIQRGAKIALYPNEARYNYARVIPGTIHVRFVPASATSELRSAFHRTPRTITRDTRWPIRFAKHDGAARASATYLERHKGIGVCRRSFTQIVTPRAVGRQPVFRVQMYRIDRRYYTSATSDPYSHDELDSSIRSGDCEATRIGQVAATLTDGAETHTFTLSDPCGPWASDDYNGARYKLYFRSGIPKDTGLYFVPKVRFENARRDYRLTWRQHGEKLSEVRFRVTWKGSHTRHIDQSEDDFVNICKNDHRTIRKKNGRLYCVDPKHGHRWIKMLTGPGAAGPMAPKAAKRTGSSLCQASHTCRPSGVPSSRL